MSILKMIEAFDADRESRIRELEAEVEEWKDRFFRATASAIQATEANTANMLQAALAGAFDRKPAEQACTEQEKK